MTSKFKRKHEKLGVVSVKWGLDQLRPLFLQAAVKGTPQAIIYNVFKRPKTY